MAVSPEGRRGDGPLAAVILSGGLSRRMRRNKALIEVQGRPLLLYVLDRAVTFAASIVLAIGAEDSLQEYGSLVPKGVKIMKDTLNVKSPLAGMLTGLEAVDTEYAAVLPVDAPFTNPKVILYLFDRAQGFDAAIPVWPDGKSEPLHTVYRVSPTLRAIRASLAMGKLRLIEMCKMLTVNFIPIEELRRLDPDLRCFVNINTPEDLERVERMLRGGG